MFSQYGETYGPLAAEIGSDVWGTPANFNGFRVLSSLLQRRRSTEANQTLHDVWPSPGLVHYIYIFGGSFPITEFCQVQNSLCVQVLRSPILAPLLHCTRIVGVRQTLRRSAEDATYIRQGPSRWALAHILVLWVFLLFAAFMVNKECHSAIMMNKDTYCDDCVLTCE